MAAHDAAAGRGRTALRGSTSLSLSKGFMRESRQEGLQMSAAQLGPNGSAGGEHEASCRMMLMLLSLKPIIASTHRGAGKVFIRVIGCVSQGCTILMIMG
jgi:hypothetical protein